MKLSAIHTILLIAFTLSLYGQESRLIQGYTKDAATNKEIPFVNIVLNKNNRGLMSNEQGFFQVNISEAFETDTLNFSCIGYKLAIVPLSEFKDSPIEIQLIPHAFELAEHVVTPLSPEEFIRRAISKIPENYADKTSMSTGYYYELLSENGKFLKYEEAVTDTWVPIITDTTKAHTSILYARKAKDLATLQFMQDSRAKKAAKAEKKKAKKLAKNPNSVNEDEDENNSEAISANFGGPSGVLDSDPARNKEVFLKEENFKKFDYSFDPQVVYGDKTLIVIRFEQRKKVDQMSANGKVFIDLDSDAIVAIEYSGVYHISAAIKTVLFAMGYSIENPKFNSIVHYREYNNRWYLSSVKRDMKAQVTKKHMFSKNEVSTFDIEQAYVTQELKTNNVNPIAKEYRMNTDKDMTEQARFNDDEFWDSYVVVRPKKLQTYLKQ